MLHQAAISACSPQLLLLRCGRCMGAPLGGAPARQRAGRSCCCTEAGAQCLGLANLLFLTSSSTDRYREGAGIADEAAAPAGLQQTYDCQLKQRALARSAAGLQCSWHLQTIHALAVSGGQLSRCLISSHS